MMSCCNRPGYILLLTLALFLSVLQSCWANYDENKCNDLTKSGQKLERIPHFLGSFTALSETTVQKDESENTEQYISQEKLWFSSMFKQFMKQQVTPKTLTWLHIDEIDQDCIYKELNGNCEEHSNTCKKRASEFVDDEGVLSVGSFLSIIQWPRMNRKQVDLGSEVTRGLQSRKYATCDYDQVNDLTIVSEWNMLDTNKYINLDPRDGQLLKARHRKYKNGEQVSDENIDYSEYKLLSYPEIPNGLQIGEVECRHVEGKFRSVNPPTPSVRHGFITQADVTLHGMVASEAEYSSYTEYNYNSQILFTVYERPVPGENEKETEVHVFDFLTKNYFHYSMTNGNCRVAPEFLYKGSPVMPSPQAFWHFTTTKKHSYLGVYMNRGIPCNTWLFEYPEGGPGVELDSTVTLYLATPRWLQSQGKPSDMFYPVQTVTRGKSSSVFRSIYTFKDNPGYHIPEIASCFNPEDSVVGKLTLENTNYYKKIANRKVGFQYRFRTFIQRTTGIVSHMRVAQITAAPSPTNVDETEVSFRIFGLFAGINSTDTAAYRADPVSSHDAVDKIHDAVNNGDAKFTLDGTQVTLQVKKGSFSVWKNYDHFENVDHPKKQTESPGAGYSDITMASVGLTLLIVSLALSVLTVFLYKRWTEGQDILPSFRMQSLSSDKS